MFKCRFTENSNLLSLVILRHNYHGDTSWQQDTHGPYSSTSCDQPVETCSPADTQHGREAVVDHPAPRERQVATATRGILGTTRRLLSHLTLAPQKHEQVKQLL